MSYDYQTQRAELFTERGVETLTAIRDKARRLLETAGAFMAERAWDGVCGDTWTMLAALDYLVEKGEIVRVPDQGSTWAQHQVFRAPLQLRM